MEPTLAASQQIEVGTPIVIESNAPNGSLAVVFEDDGETGYFYALGRDRAEAPILDALHIYAVAGVTDRRLPSHVQILWSPDATKACLVINRYPHAVFDFTTRRGYSRDAFPDPAPESGWTRHQWDDSLRSLFYT